jgi:hypothetical protein
VLQASVLRPWIDDVGTAQLLNAAQTIEGRVAHNVEHQSTWHADEAENRVIDDFCGFHTQRFLRQMFLEQRMKRIERIFLILMLQAAANENE